MSAELLPGEENEQGPAEEARTLSERDRYFAMRIALGDSIRQASKTIGVTDRHGRRLVKQPQIEDAIRQYAAEAVDSARRVIVGKVRWAARRMVQLASPGGSQHKGANVEFAALKYILDVNRVPTSWTYWLDQLDLSTRPALWTYRLSPHPAPANLRHPCHGSLFVWGEG
jgi:transposase